MPFGWLTGLLALGSMVNREGFARSVTHWVMALRGNHEEHRTPVYDLNFLLASVKPIPFWISMAIFESASTCFAIKGRAFSAKSLGSTTTPFKSPMR